MHAFNMHSKILIHSLYLHSHKWMLKVDVSRWEICKKDAFLCKTARGKLANVYALVIKVVKFSKCYHKERIGPNVMKYREFSCDFIMCRSNFDYSNRLLIRNSIVRRFVWNLRSVSYRMPPSFVMEIQEDGVLHLK